MVNLTSTPRTSSISLFSLSPGPMCLSAKSSCLGKILSICLEETAADVRTLRAADAAPVRFRHRSFQATRLVSLRCLHGAPGFTDLARRIPQDLAQLCISESLRGECTENERRLLVPFCFFCPSLPPSLSVGLMRSLSLPTPANCSLYNCTVAQERANGSAGGA